MVCASKEMARSAFSFRCNKAFPINSHIQYRKNENISLMAFSLKKKWKTFPDVFFLVSLIQANIVPKMQIL